MSPWRLRHHRFVAVVLQDARARAAAEIVAREGNHRDIHPERLIGCRAAVIGGDIEADIDMLIRRHQFRKLRWSLECKPVFGYALLDKRTPVASLNIGVGE